jgi:hypothetical protein
VLGQFKRGKSTLLNALLGMPLLPTGVVPVTAIPTFIAAGAAPELRVTDGSGETRALPVSGPDDLRAQLETLVTETGNPGNRLAISCVEVDVPAALPRGGVVLIDTPARRLDLSPQHGGRGRGLPECDACLFVVSADPPITEVEIALLRIKQHVTRVIVVLNKIDAIDPADRPVAEDFLRGVLAEQAGLSDPIFCVSAHAAVRAQAGADTLALDRSGLPALELHPGTILAREKRGCCGRPSPAKRLISSAKSFLRWNVCSSRCACRRRIWNSASMCSAGRRRNSMPAAMRPLISWPGPVRTVESLEGIVLRLRADAIGAMRAEPDRVLAAEGDAEQVRPYRPRWRHAFSTPVADGWPIKSGPASPRP